MTAPGGTGETAYHLQKLVEACDHLDLYSDNAKTIKGLAENVSVGGHEWGLVGIAFSENYKELSAEAAEHIGMIESFLSNAEANMEATVENYAGANEAILAHIHQLEVDPPELKNRN